MSLPDWQLQLGRDHPLVGAIVDVEQGVLLSAETLVARLAEHRLVLLGEKHDNPDHHRLQAWVMRALARRGQTRAAAFEMLDLDVRARLVEHQRLHPDDIDGIATLVDWAQRGWPDWELYRPVFAAAVAHAWSIEPAGWSPQRLATLRKQGLDALEPAERARLGLDAPLPEAQRAALLDEIVEGHCGMAPAAALEPMIAIQRARDAHFASVLRDRAGADGGVLIAGNGHVRRDRGVPLYLQGADADLAVVALQEVASERRNPLELAASARGAFDYVWLTPRVDDIDPCVRFREQLEKMRAS
jgi:uncharacterized iron-regulated protein